MLEIPRYPDLKIIQVFQEAAKVFEVSQKFSGIKIITSWKASLLIGIDSNSQEELKRLGVSNGSNLLNSVTISWGDSTFSLERDRDTYQDHIKSSQDRYNHSNTNLKRSEKEELFSFFARKLATPTKSKSVIPLVDSQLGTLADTHNSMLEKLEELNIRLIEQAKEGERQRDNLFNQQLKEIRENEEKKAEALRKELEEREQELQRERAEENERLLAQIEKERELVNQKAESLQERESQLDTSNNTFARRQIRKDILNEIKIRTEGFSVSQGTKDLRKPVSRGMITLLIFFAIMTGYSVWEIWFAGGMTKDTPTFMPLKQILYSAGFVGTGLYFIRWTNRWLRQHADAEFQVRQFQLDIERASWVVESSLEWKKESEENTGKDMPEYLVKGLTKNLFAEGAQVESAVHPADQLASALFGSASSVKLKAGENEVEVNPKNLRRTKSRIEPNL